MTPSFLTRPWLNPFNDEGWQEFAVGTCKGQWRTTPEAYEILAIINDSPGNGDFGHTLDYFYTSCKRDGKYLRIRELFNERLAGHLLKRGFVKDGDDMVKTTF